MEENKGIYEYCQLTKHGGGILSCLFLKDFYYSTELAWQIYNECKKINDNQPYKMIWIMGVRLQPQKELFDFYSDVTRSQLIIAEAFVLNSTALRMMANFYFRAKKPMIQSRVVDSFDTAQTWLQGIDVNSLQQNR